ncbi:chemotaxis protein CheW [Polyangium aurulentum]|uniref:chemotaxis protein CheW n=1 Tax=Polyangium aurulentum TaxID=2567896 RepID=UPI0010AEB204|nr:chemotaxis protein CheW [Polyangium aurulentum]UQA56486.1 chemotaxis protein CheW [Polyangium aurulentum]
MSSGGVTSLVLTRMGGRPCAIPCEHVVEIIPRVQLDHVPEAPPEVLGVINLRGRVVPVIDMRARVSKRTNLPVYQHLVIVRAQNKQIGLAVDEVRDVVTVPDEAIEKPGDMAGVRSPGVVRIEDDLVLVLGPEDAYHAAG